MPNLQSFAVLNAKVTTYREDYQLEAPGEALDWLVLETVLGLNSGEIEDAMVDDGMDGGIDCVHIGDRDVHIFTCTYTESFGNTKKNFPQNKLDNLTVTFQKVMNKSLTEKDVNPALWDKTREIWALFESGPLNFHFYVCSNRRRPTEAAMRRFEASLSVYAHVDFAYWDLEDLVRGILRQRRPPVDGKIRFVDASYFGKSNGSLVATVATVPATDIVELMRDPAQKDRINEDIFDENVRVDLGLKNPINRGIRESALSDDNFEFWYLNNGVTMVCDECRYAPNTRTPTATLTNVQIVNGGQTTRTLFHANLDDPDKIRNVDVLVRIIQTRDRSISEKISEAANKQTPVRTRDLRANDWIQRKLEEEFRSLGYYYERKKNQHSAHPLEKRVDAEQVGQAVLAYNLDMPSEAKDQKSIVFGDKYADIFDEDSTTAASLLFLMQLYKPIEETKRQIQRKKRKKQPITDREAFESLATFHVLNAMKVVAELEELDLSDPRQAVTAREKATVLIGELVEKAREDRGELYTHDRYFKQKTTNAEVRNHILATYDQGKVA